MKKTLQNHKLSYIKTFLILPFFICINSVQLAAMSHQAQFKSKTFIFENEIVNVLSDEDSTPGCEYVLQRAGAVMISRHYVKSTQTCYVSIRPFTIKNLTYRSFLFTNDGMLMVFNSYGPGSVVETTGARTFYMFPRQTDYPQLEILENGYVLVRTQSQHEFIFNAESFKIDAVSDAAFTEDLNVSKTNKGGLELQLNRGLLLDLGFIMGQNPAEIPNRSVFFKDRNQKSCVIKNKDVFNYRDDDVYLDMTDAQLKTKLQRQCTKLDFGF